MTLRITMPENPSDADRNAVLAPLRDHNIRQAGDPRFRPVALLLTDEHGDHLGGLWGKCLYDWLFVELLAVPEAHRGGHYGTALMQQAEEIALAHGCIGIWLDTFEFQAHGFYEKLGFEVFGAIDDHPVGHKRYFLRKHLQAPAHEAARQTR